MEVKKHVVSLSTSEVQALFTRLKKLADEVPKMLNDGQSAFSVQSFSDVTLGLSIICKDLVGKRVSDKRAEALYEMAVPLLFIAFGLGASGCVKPCNCHPPQILAVMPGTRDVN